MRKLFRIVFYAREHLSTRPCQCPLVWLQTIVSLGPLLCGMYSCWSLALWSVQLLVPCFVECTAADPLFCGVYSCWSLALWSVQLLVLDCCLRHAETFTMDMVTGSSGPNEWVDNNTARTLYIYSAVEMLRVGRLHYSRDVEGWKITLQ